MADTDMKLGVLLRDFFERHLKIEKGASPRTIEAYRDTFRLYFQYVSQRLKRAPSDVVLGDLAAPVILAFLDWLEQERGNSTRTRNARLAALKSFLRYVAFREIAALPTIQASLAVPVKRWDKAIVGFLSDVELDAILAACDRATWSGERDYVLFLVTYNTGARVAEMTGLKRGDVNLASRGSSLRITGKGRKERELPLWPATARVLGDWLKRVGADADDPVFPNRWGRPMSRSAVEKRLAKAAKAASVQEASLVGRRVSPHTLRHTTAMHMLKKGEHPANIALYLGHESPTTTQLYLQADMAMKEKALQKLQPVGARRRYRPSDNVLRFLDELCRTTATRASGGPVPVKSVAPVAD